MLLAAVELMARASEARYPMLNTSGACYALCIIACMRGHSLMISIGHRARSRIESMAISLLARTGARDAHCARSRW